MTQAAEGALLRLTPRIPAGLPSDDHGAGGAMPDEPVGDTHQVAPADVMTVFKVPQKRKKDLTKKITVSWRESVIKDVDKLVKKAGGEDAGWNRSNMTQHLLQQIFAVMRQNGDLK